MPELRTLAEPPAPRASSRSVPGARGRARAAIDGFVSDETGSAAVAEYLVVLTIWGLLAAEFLLGSAAPPVVEEWSCRSAYIYDGDCPRAGEP